MAVSPGSDLLLREWRAANKKAHQMEQALARACLDALESSADWPTPEWRAEVQSARALADDLFQVAMGQIDEIARVNKRLPHKGD